MKKLLLFIVLCASSVLIAQDYYAILGVPRTATAGEIETAFRGKRREHPNLVEQRLRRQQPPLDEDLIKEQIRQAAERFQDYSAAFDVLKEPSKKRIYDENLWRGHDQAREAVARHERGESYRRAREADIAASVKEESERRLRQEEQIRIARDRDVAQADRLIRACQFRDAIDVLRRYQPATSAKIVNTYIQFINNAPPEQKLKILAEAEQFAQDVNRQGINLPKFNDAYQRLRNLAQQLRATQTPKQITTQELALIERMIAAGYYRTAIDRLKRYQPAMSAKIVNTYIQFISDAPPEQKLKILMEAERFARAVDRDLGRQWKHWREFNDAYRTLRDLGTQLRAAPAPTPAPTPARAVSVPQLGRDLQTLQKQLDALTRQLGNVR